MSSILLFNFIDNFLSILFFKHQVIFNSLELIIFFFINIFLSNFFSRLLKIFSKLVFSPEPILKILNLLNIFDFLITRCIILVTSSI